MRIGGPNRNSNWVTIKLRPGAVAQGSRERNTPQRGEPEQRKAQPERANPGAAGTGALKKDPFVIPGGGAKTGTLTIVDMTNTPLWMRLTHMRCFAPQIEEDTDTEIDVHHVYAIVVTVRPNRNNLGQSAISASASKIFRITRCGHADNNPRIVFPNTPAWGPSNGAPVPIRVPFTGGEQNPDAIVFVALLERDSDGMPIPLLLELIRGKIRNELTTPLVFTIGGRIRSALKPDPTSPKGDDLIGLVAVKVSEDELRRAQQGEVVRLNLEIKATGGAGAASFGTQPSALNSGSWTVELQLGREGVEMQGLQLALCNDGTQWYGWALIGVCAGRGGVKARFHENWELLGSPN
jgi:hypothetical protein